MEEAAEVIIQDIDWIKSELKSPGSVIHRMYSSNSPKKDLILLWGQKLEELGREPATISTEIRRDLKSLGMDSAVSWAYEVLPFKYKNKDMMLNTSDDLETRSVEPFEDSSKKKAQFCQKVNADYIEHLLSTAKTLQHFAKQLSTNVELQNVIPEEEMGEYFQRWDHTLERARQILDGRDKVLPSTQHILIYCLASSTLNYTYANYVKRVREMASLTAKQSGKILKGHVSKMQLLYEPKSQDEAIDSGFYGIQCGECGSWRTGIKWIAAKNDNLLNCYRCGHTQKPKTLKLPREEPS